MPIERTDIIIVGGGPVGASLALSLKSTALRIALVEARAPAPAQGWDSRIYTISPHSRRILADLGAWQALDAERVTPVRRMLVFGDQASRLEFSAYEAGVPELAWTVEGGALARALWAGLAAQDNVELVCPAVPERLQVDDMARLSLDTGRLSLDTGRLIEAKLVVGADGAHSFVRRQLGFSAELIPYGQLGVVANFNCERAHAGTAFQWFRDDGVLAWLPLSGRRMSMVWSTPEQHAQELLCLPENELCRHVAQAGANALGALDLLTAPAAFPLSRMKVKRITAPHVALVGDAAHVVHPLAGQGVNLGFADAAGLARELARAPAIQDAGDPILLRRYERARAEEILAMRWTTDGLARLFKAPALKGLRNWGLNSVNDLAVIKTLLVRHALG